MTRDVVCANCGEVYCETNERFNAQSLTNPAMLRLKEPYRTYWPDVIPNDDSLHFEAVTCPGCDAPMLNSHGMAILKKEVNPPWKGIGATRPCRNVRDVAMDDPNPIKTRNKRILQLQKEGWTIQRIADKYGISKGRVSVILKRMRGGR